ncbi:MAG: PstS family phosphate ABC transporter substrate-binding protein, partial [Deltaproteobacteria bacterium]|nr:PstS family phosphate ABC transporter substrate-binding protein [Deltaproteobacteria bacterium]
AARAVIILLLGVSGALVVPLLSPSRLPAAEARPTLRISGSSTLLPVTESAAEIYLLDRRDLLLTVSGTGTGEGIRSLIDGNIDIADASRDVKIEETRRAAANKTELLRHVVALDCLAVIVHPSNPVGHLTMSQLKDIYLGTIVNWSQVGGPDMVIVPINRDSSSGTFEMWVEEVLQGARHRPDAQVQSSSGGVAYAVSGNRHALGYVSLGFLSPEVRALAVDGVEPTLETASDGTYPIKRDLYMFTRPDRSAEVDKFLAFMESETGRDIVREAGFIPLSDSGARVVSGDSANDASGDAPNGGPAAEDAVPSEEPAGRAAVSEIVGGLSAAVGDSAPPAEEAGDSESGGAR